VSNEVFLETLELAAQAGTNFSGVLCGRATWQEGIPVYGQQGYAALEQWLATTGVANIEALNRVLALGARPWWTAYGGKENIELVEQVVS
jgi:tagatose 1,6-diphosphate aldolase